MKRIISLVLIALTAFTAVALSACQKNEQKSSDSAVVDPVAAASIPDDLEPYSLNAEGKPSSYFKNDKNENGQITRHYTYDALGVLQGSTGFEYDENGYPSQDILYDAEGNVTSRVLYEYNAAGLLTKQTNVNANGEVTAVVEFTYDKEGRTLSMEKSDGKGNVTSKQTNEYDEEGNLTTFTQYKNGAVEYSITYVYNDDGSVVEYKYDGEGNLINN